VCVSGSWIALKEMAVLLTAAGVCCHPETADCTIGSWHTLAVADGS
jgi:hypothetical protein